MRQLKISRTLTHRDEASINRYFQDVNKYALVTPEEEVALTQRIHDGDQVALEKLVVSNLRFVISVAKQYQHQGLSFSDLINEGNLGLVKAAQKFDETRGFKFISYAVWWIRQSIMQAIANHTRIVRLPVNRLTAINKIKKAIPYLEQELEREPTDREIADFLDMPGEDVELANTIKKRQVSFDMPISQEYGSDLNLYDFVQTGNIPSTDHNIMNESLIEDVSRALNKLSKREAAILTMSYGLQGTPVFTLNYIAVKYNMSRERVRQLRISGLNKLKSLLRNSRVFQEY
ncbi:MAG: RNA polymerase sigma factor RpoD/SigA [Bacteroidetes bacterium]|nr:RNA polymerase sigma factor RpoD/SigA [Bacteroidota bacterium]